MEIEQLAQFLRIAELQNFTRAAEELGISQSAISRSIQRLESEFGQPLLERQTRRVTLTDAGRLLRSRAEKILQIIEDTKSEIADDGESGRLRLAAIPTVAPFFLPGLLREFTESLPRATVTVQEHTTDNLLKRISQGEADLGILALPIPAKYLEVEPLFDEELLLVMAPEHRLAKRRRIKSGDIEHDPFVLLDEAHCLADNIVSFCRRQAFHPVSMERTSQLATVQELVALNHGISMIPAMARALDTSDRRVYHSLAGEPPRRTLAAIWNPYRFETKLFRSFRQLLYDHVRKQWLPRPFTGDPS